jgi:hypothetical protein
MPASGRGFSQPVCARYSKRPARTDREDGETDVLGDERLPVDEVLALDKLHELASDKADEGADDDAERDLIQPGDVKPLADGVSVRGVEREVEGDVQEWEGRAIVAARLDREQVPQVGGDVLVGILATDDGLGENLHEPGVLVERVSGMLAIRRSKRKGADAPGRSASRRQR